ncbi:reverse transcriptase [Plakobranchus ocellatus]|uniref:Reverse transcriptase n=1 Tax=Plakobranchus ocellatus TaxID=259542 RepID=A0AAV4AP42_9GAST|nr:reverse transcriptase [Plakobranchus ocellatus]
MKSDLKIRISELRKQSNNLNSAMDKMVERIAKISCMPPLRISFLNRDVYDRLPLNANLVRWKMKNNPKFPLCQGIQSTEHILISCKVAQVRIGTRAETKECCYDNMRSKRPTCPIIEGMRFSIGLCTVHGLVWFLYIASLQQRELRLSSLL